MKKLLLYKAAFDSAYTSLGETNPVTLAETSLTAFKTGGFDPQDLSIWNQATSQIRSQLSQVQKQILPSEQAALLAAQKAAQSKPVVPQTPPAAA